MVVHAGEPVTPRPSHFDDCDLGARTGDIVRLVADGVAGVTVDGAHVYYSTREGGWCFDGICRTGTAGLWRLPRCGGTAEAVGSTFSFADRDRTGDLAESDLHVYFLGDHLYRISKSDGARLDLQIASECVADFVASPDSVFVYDICTGSILRASSTDVSLQVVVENVFNFTTDPLGQLARLAVGNALYFSTVDGVVRWAPESTTPEVVFPTADGVLRMAADDRGLMVLHRMPSEPGYSSPGVRLAYVPAGGGAPLQLMQDEIWGMTTSATIVVDSGRAFYQPAMPPDVAPGVGGLAMQPTDGSGQGYLFEAGRSAHALAAYGERLYWVQQYGSLLTGVRQQMPVPVPDTTPPRWRFDGAAPSAFDAIGLDPAGNALGVGTGPVPLQMFPRRLVTVIDPQGQQVSSAIADWPGQFVIDGTGALTAIIDETAGMSATRFTSSGSLVWKQSIPGFHPRAPSADAAGNVHYVAEILDSTGTDTIAILTRLDTNGNVAWTREIGAASGVTGFTARSTAAVGTDGVVVQGEQRGAMDFGAGVLDPQGIRASTAVLRFGADGSLRWSRLVRGMDSVVSSAVAAIADGRSVAMGQTADFVDVGSGPVYVKRALDPCAAIVEYDASGSVAWVRLVDGGANDIALGPAGDVYVAIGGSENCVIDFGVAGATGSVMTCPGIAKLDPSGGFLWSRSFSADRLDPRLVVGATGVFVGGTVNPTLSSSTAFLAMFDP